MLRLWTETGLVVVLSFLLLIVLWYVVFLLGGFVFGG